MKKFFASILAVVMVVAMNVSAFAKEVRDYYANVENEINEDDPDICDGGEDYTLFTNVFSENNGTVKAFKVIDGKLKGYTVAKDGKLDSKFLESMHRPVQLQLEDPQLDGGAKLYLTIAKKGEDENSDKYYYATKTSDVEKLKATVTAKSGKNLVTKDAKIVKKI